PPTAPFLLSLTTLFRSPLHAGLLVERRRRSGLPADRARPARRAAAGALHDRVQHLVIVVKALVLAGVARNEARLDLAGPRLLTRSEEHTSELQSPDHLV